MLRIKNKRKRRVFRERGLARPIEEVSARLPSDLFLWMAVASIGSSLVLRIMGRKPDALFVGEWAPTFLILGLYNKLVKIHGHEGELEEEFD